MNRIDLEKLSNSDLESLKRMVRAEEKRREEREKEEEFTKACERLFTGNASSKQLDIIKEYINKNQERNTSLVMAQSRENAEMLRMKPMRDNY